MFYENKKAKIRDVMKHLDDGHIVKINGGCMWERIGNRGYPLIFWRNFGESANKRTIRDLTWLINTIFGCKNKDFDFKIVNSVWD